MVTEEFAPETVRRISPLEKPNWDALVTSRPDFSFFHSAAWAKVLMDTYGFVPHYFFAGNADRPEGMQPLMEVDSWLTGRRGVALPFTDECVPLDMDKGAFANVFAEAVAFGKSRRWKHLELRGGRNFFGPEVPASVSFFGHKLDLTVGENLLFEKMDNAARRAVRKAEKDGVMVEISRSLEAVRDFYKMQCLTRKRHGLPPQPFVFFVNIQRYILSQNLGIVVLARYGGKVIAGAIFFHLGNRAIYKYGASDHTRQHLRGSNLVMWKAIKWLTNNGMRSLNLGKTSLANEGLRRFKSNLGAQEAKIEYVRFNLQQDRFVTEHDRVFGWHNTFFRIMPGFLSRAAGSLLYKHWA